jgi:hypothetical protein
MAGLKAWRPNAQNNADFFFHEMNKHDDIRMGLGDTEDDAIADLARKAGLRLWNEEQRA